MLSISWKVVAHFFELLSGAGEGRFCSLQRHFVSSNTLFLQQTQTQSSRQDRAEWSVIWSVLSLPGFGWGLSDQPPPAWAIGGLRVVSICAPTQISILLEPNKLNACA